ncbi:MAG: hypothetical protein WB791_01760 [Waddliaceae bacterium]
MKSMKDRIHRLESLISRLKGASRLSEKLMLLKADPTIQHALQQADPLLLSCLEKADHKTAFVILSIIAVGEGPVVFQGIKETDDVGERLKTMVQQLWEVEQFYDVIGGIIGYHTTLLTLIQEKTQTTGSKTYLKPHGIDLEEKTPDTDRFVYLGIYHLPEMAEIYPVGGAGDRLDLHDEGTGEHLPVAKLLFCGRTLLEGLVRDLQAREYLYYKCFHKQVTTPIVMMTSQEKNNHQRIFEICEENEWFSRPRSEFFFFSQPLVPVITKEGRWSTKAPLTLLLKPGGHGVLWKLARDKGVFEWLASRQRKKALLRQINNPIAGTDHGLPAFCGFGCHHDKAFGFASCPRMLHAKEGMDVLVEEKNQDGYAYCLSNIEYTDFLQKGVEDVPDAPGSPYSQFPANTNILFADLKVIEQAISRCPIPGMILNLKNKAPYADPSGKHFLVEAGRLESTMQNISDCLIERFPAPLDSEEMKNLNTFITYNKRRKTISVTKKGYDSSESLLETPEGCFFDMLKNHQDLLSRHCRMRVPTLCSQEEFLANGPNFILNYHPALGPLFSVIGKKIRGGRLAEGSELQLEIAEIDIEELELDGSLLVVSDSPMGRRNQEGVLEYGEHSGKCTLRSVKVHNRGIDRNKDNVYWKNRISRRESMIIHLKGNAEFFAEEITFKGSHRIEVPDGYRFHAYEEKGEIRCRRDKIASPTWCWHYSCGINEEIKLEKKHGAVCEAP